MTINTITRGTRLFFLFLFLVSVDCSSSDISDSILLLFNTTSITARLTPAQELYEPPPMSPAPNLTIVEGVNTTGAAALTLTHVESNISTLVLEIAQNGLTQITNVGIHQAPPDANGPQVINVTSAVSGLNMSGFVITRGQNVSSIIADGIFATPQDYYIQVSTPAYPLGAIRGVFMDNSPANGVGLLPNQTVSATCLPSNVIPPNPNKQQTATCTLFLTNIANDTATMYFLIITTLYTSDASGAALYKGVANTSGDLFVNLTSRIRFDSLNANNAFRGLFWISSSSATHLLSNPEMYYFEMDTLNHTQGATRGQFVMPPTPPPPPSMALAPMPTSSLPPLDSPNFPPAPSKSLGPTVAPSPQSPPSPPSSPSLSIPLASSASCRNEAISTWVGMIVGILLLNLICVLDIRRPYHARVNRQLILDFAA